MIGRQGVIPQPCGERHFSGPRKSAYYRISLLTLMAIISVSTFALMGLESAQAQSARSHHRAVSAGQVHPQAVRRMRVRRVKPKKKSFLGGLFATKPVKHRRARRPSRGLKPLFNAFKVPGYNSGQIKVKSYETPASIRASYARRMRAAAQRDAIDNRRLRRGFETGLKRARRGGGKNAYPASGRTSGNWGRGKYRTMCVRMCDGYYFPVSFKARSRNFKTEEQRCNASCTGSPTKLFFYSNPGGSIKNMRALDGVRYKNIENAFKYRKEYVADCRCTPDPWSEQARQRHEGFALAQKDRIRAKNPVDEALARDNKAKEQRHTARIEQNSNDRPRL